MCILCLHVYTPALDASDCVIVFYCSLPSYSRSHSWFIFRSFQWPIHIDYNDDAVDGDDESTKELFLHGFFCLTLLYIQNIHTTAMRMKSHVPHNTALCMHTSTVRSKLHTPFSTLAVLPVALEAPHTTPKAVVLFLCFWIEIQSKLAKKTIM